MPRFSIDADLTVMVDGQHPLHITGEGSVLTIEIPNRASAVYIYRSSRFALQELQRLSGTPLPMLLQEVEIQVKVGDKVIASTDVTDEPGPIPRLLGIAPLQLYWRRVFRALLSS